MQRRHRVGLDIALEPRTHDVLVALPEFLDETRYISEVIGAVGVSHQDIFAAYERDSIDVSPAQASLWCPEHSGAVRQGQIRRLICGAVDDQDLSHHA